MKSVGVVKEIKNFERRVSLCPEAVALLTEQDIPVFVERDAGEPSGYSDEAYAQAGATIVPSAEKVFRKADIMVKVQPLSSDECELTREDQIFFSFINLYQHPDRLLQLLKTKTIFFSAELLTDDQGEHLVLKAISEIAGRLALHVAANLLTVSQGGKGILLSGISGVVPARVLVVGSGLVGKVAAVQAWHTGADVTLLSVKNLNEEAMTMEKDGLSVEMFSRERLESLLPGTDVMIVAVQAVKSNLPDLRISAEQVAMMENGSVIIDLSVEHSPIVETSHVTSLSQPTFVSQGVIHYGVPNISATIPKTATRVYARTILPFIIKLAREGLSTSLDSSPELLSALASYKGKVTNRVISKRFDTAFFNIFDLLELKL
ncbi:MAG TPA: hypothetical protein ENJ10_08405 [Caldithrix abyssi]|uniref:Alanine dehydrogenase n=1 Tax=Caldithrix abyssi TaxID=187145 RepID=A0A7V1PVL0_CALAY|nr:hypothetical protein [Caldithrix abyssi]